MGRKGEGGGEAEAEAEDGVGKGEGKFRLGGLEVVCKQKLLELNGGEGRGATSQRTAEWNERMN